MSTPLMKQYKEIKEKYQEYILFFRLGDFYEMFFDDAKIASKILGLTLTSRNREKDIEVPLAGIPYHSSRAYISKLVSSGYKVAICEQTGDPKLSKGIVKREVVKIITAGTIQDIDSIDSKTNNYLACINILSNTYAISYLDLTTGEFNVLESSEDNLLSDIYKIEPSEIILTSECKNKLSEILSKLNIQISIINKMHDEEKFLKDYFGLITLDSFSLSGKKCLIQACAYILDYVLSLQFESELNISRINLLNKSNFLEISSSTLRNLELLKNQRDKSTYGTLLWVLDKCKSSIGSRKLRQLIQNPLIDLKEINKRYDDVQFLIDNILIREEIKGHLENIYDIERLLGKVIFSNENARDLLSLKASIKSSFDIYSLWEDKFKNIDFDKLKQICNLIEISIDENASITIREGNIIKKGYNSQVDEYKEILNNGTNILLDIEKREREKTGIKNLKIKYNNVFGYFIEVSKLQTNLVPDTYIRKQTISNAERYITEEIKNYEDKIINAKSKLNELEYSIFKEIGLKIKEVKNELVALSNILAYIDISISFATVSLENKYTRAQFNNELDFKILDARHPVVEKLIPENQFIANNVNFSEKENFAILTGPNMSGKSTYMKQIALICIMAQIGCFIPASYANLHIVDKILTRIGASDDLITGQSTFMVEMSEVASIINLATKDSLIILDEVGRGTSTYDGLSIAFSISSYIIENIKAKTIFATHYHELTKLEEKYTEVVNYRIEVDEKDNKVNFLRNIVKGGADKSYGIEVAKLAGLPKEIIRNSKKMLKSIEEEKKKGQLSLFDSFEYENYDKIELLEEEIEILKERINSIKNIDINNMTPMQALILLEKIKNEI